MANGRIFICPNSRCHAKLGPYVIQRHGNVRCAYCGTTFRV